MSCRPQSRLGYVADPAHYSHYQNFHEIQAQLAHHDRYQRMYHHYMAHQVTAPDGRQRAITPDPRSSPACDHIDPRTYVRSQSVADTRQWSAPPQTVQAVHSRSQTPINQLSYHHGHNKPPVAMLPPQIVVNAPRDSYVRDYSHIYSDRRTVYASEQGFNSLPRRHDDRGQNGMVSGPAQV